MLKIYAPGDDAVDIFECSGNAATVLAQFNEALDIMLSETADPAATLCSFLHGLEYIRDDTTVFDAVVSYMEAKIRKQDDGPNILKI